jgi:transmembrane sensor
MLNEASANEELLVNKWIEADGEHRRYYDHFKLIWEESRELALERSPDEEQAWNRLQQRIQRAKEPGKVLPFGAFKFRQVAAIFVAVVSTAIIAYMVLNNKRNNELITFSTGNFSRIDTLPDGSFITLNKNSAITYTRKFTGDERKVELKGEAFFNVAPDKKKPFIITTDEAIVMVTGTSFNVNTMEGKTKVIVETGSVEVSNKKQKIALKPGEQVAVGKADTSIVKQRVPDRLYTYYRTKQFVCDNTPLWKLVEVLTEAYHVKIIIEKPAAKDLKLNTTFKNASLTTIINVVCETFSLTAEKRGDSIILK